MGSAAHVAVFRCSCQATCNSRHCRAGRAVWLVLVATAAASVMCGVLIGRNWAPPAIISGDRQSAEIDNESGPPSADMPLSRSRNRTERGLRSAASSLPNANYRRKFAVVVGIDRYINPELSPLDNAVNDAREFSELLKTEFGFLAEDVLLLIDSDATKSRILGALDEWLSAKALQKDDALLWFFAGHGDSADGDPGADGGCLAPVDAWHDDFESWISVPALKERLQRVPCRHRAVLLDCCYSGSLFRTPRGQASVTSTSTSLSNHSSDEASEGARFGVSRLPISTEDSFLSTCLANPAFCGLSAGRMTPVSDGLGENRHSIFTSALMDVMRERANSSRQDHAFTFSQLAVQVQERVANASSSRQVPDWGVLDDRAAGDFVFTPTVRRATPRELSEERRRSSHQRLMRLYVDNGWKEHEDGEYGNSLVWFAQACLDDADDRDRQWVHRTRLCQVLNLCPTLIAVFEHPQSVTDAKFVSEQSDIATTSADGQIRLWSLDSFSQPRMTWPSAGAYGLSVDKQNSRLLSWSLTGATVWDLATGTPQSAVLGSGYGVARGRFDSAGSSVMLSGLFNPEHSLGGRLYRLRDGEVTFQLLPQGTSTSRACMSFDGQRVGIAYYDSASQKRLANVWNVSTLEAVGPAVEMVSSDRAMNLNTDGSQLVIVDDQGVTRVVDTQTGAQVGPEMKREAKSQWAAFNQRGDRLLTIHEPLLSVQSGRSTESGYAQLWAWPTGEPLGDRLEDDGDIHWATFSDDGKLLLTATDTAVSVRETDEGGCYSCRSCTIKGSHQPALTPMLPSS